jgi:hypothetical protein
MLPGNCMPIHTDPHTSYESNSQRYWVPLQDYQNGHWFVYNDVVITDCRFPNEIAKLKNQDAKIVWIKRGIIPHWYDIAARANKGDLKAAEWVKQESIHSSESSWAGTSFDYVIENDSSIEKLYSQLKNLVQS